MAKPPEGKAFGTPPLPVAGVRLAAGAAGLRYEGRDDVALIELCEGTVAAGVFTRNRFKAAPVIVAQAHLAARAPRYCLINAGVANAGLGAAGVADAKRACAALADLTGVPVEAVLPFSTGVIGQRLPEGGIEAVLPGLLPALSEDAWGDAARAIMTTDTAPKTAGVSCGCGDATATITGVAKGAGMIHPDMATMLAFIATDVEIDAEDARCLLGDVCATSFNSITVDGDTSTNDACMLFATGRSGLRFREFDEARRAAFVAALEQLAQTLAQAIIRDAEGASRFVTVEVERASDAAAARAVAMTVADSPLVKTALSTGDPNWGRVLAAIGRAPVEAAVEAVDFYFGDARVVEKGVLAPGYDEAQGVAALAGPEVTIRIVLNAGDASARVWTSDLTADYVRINADYRS